MLRRVAAVLIEAQRERSLILPSQVPTRTGGR
jgi:hypothetical protein